MAQKDNTNQKSESNISFFSKIKKEVYIIIFLLICLIGGTVIAYQTITTKNKIIQDFEEKEQIAEDERTRIADIKSNMELLVDEETKFLQVSSSAIANSATKENANLIYKSETVRLINRIGKKITKDDYKKFDENLLMNYARHLNMIGDEEKSKTLFEYIVNKSNDSITLAHSYRELAKIHAIPTSNNFNPDQSRYYRQKDIAIAKAAPKLDARYLKLIDLYELWAKDEYTHLKNPENGNQLIDTALYCIGRLPDYSPQKKEIVKRIRSTYSFYNDILIEENTTGIYKFYINNQGYGDANITVNESQGSIKIDYITEGKLVGQLKGSGGFIDFGLLKFDVQIENYSDVYKTKKTSSGNIELTSKKGKILDGFLNEYGKKPLPIKLVKQ